MRTIEMVAKHIRLVSLFLGACCLSQLASAQSSVGAAPMNVPMTNVTISTRSVEPVPPKPWVGARWILTLDRLTSVGGWSVNHTEPNDFEVKESGTVAALAGGGVTTGSSVSLNPYAVPRLSLDWKPTAHFTLGLGVAGIVTSGDIELQRDGVSNLQVEEKRWLVAATPRIGYLMPVTDFLVFWGRAGATFSAQRVYGQTSSLRSSLASVDVEGTALWPIGSHFGIATTFALALPVYGHYKSHIDSTIADAIGAPTDRERPFSMTSFIAQLGVVAAL